MKKKSIKVARVFIKFIMTLILLISLGGLGLSIFNSISYNVEAAKYIYFLIGVFVIPFEFIFSRDFGKIQQQDGNIVGLIISMALIIISIVTLVNSSKMFDDRYSSMKRTLAGTITNVITFITFAIFAFSAVIFTINGEPIINIFNTIGPEFVKMLTISYGINLMYIINILIAYIGMIMTLLVFVLFLASKVHKSNKIKVVNSIYFYSKQFEEPVEASKAKDAQSEESTEQAPVHTESPQARELLNKIMQLDELKKAGKLTDVQYTRLRQKAIKRYRG